MTFEEFLEKYKNEILEIRKKAKELEDIEKVLIKLNYLEGKEDDSNNK